MSEAIIATERPGLIVREFTDSDTQTLCDVIGANAEHLIPFFGAEVPEAYTTPEGLREKLAQRKRDGSFWAGIWERDELVGSVEVYPDFAEAETGEVCYWISKESAGQGLTTFALRAIMNSQRERFSKFQAHTHESNLASQALLKKAGFRFVRPQYGYLMFDTSTDN
jgi:RimJ/RimL family protein N-acetyltransferase